MKRTDPVKAEYKAKIRPGRIYPAGRRMLALGLALLLVFAAALLAGCGTKPLDESQLPNLENNNQNEQTGPDTNTDTGTNTNDRQGTGTADNGGGDTSGSSSGSNSGGGDTSGGNSSGQDNLNITERQAMDIAVGRVPGSTRSNISKLSLDFDDGRWIYEGELRYNGLEYDFEIDAQTGNILEWEIDD